MGPAARINVELDEIFVDLIFYEFCLEEKKILEKTVKTR